MRICCQEETLKEVQRVCELREIPLDFVPQLVGLSALEPQPKPMTATNIHAPFAIELPTYFRWKYALDFVVATIVFVASAPFLAVAAEFRISRRQIPLVFWQQRLGAGGRSFTIYKLRTLRPPFDQFGEPIPEDKRSSWAGAFLRRLRLDELPQLFNVLVGEMSLIGPRPLLPRDQPTNPTVRLMVRPGITGLAQVNGGTLLTPSEKDAFDEWYVRHASFWVDLYIVLKTLKVLISGQHRPESDKAATRAIGKATGEAANEPSTVPAVEWIRRGVGPAE